MHPFEASQGHGQMLPEASYKETKACHRRISPNTRPWVLCAAGYGGQGQGAGAAGCPATNTRSVFVCCQWIDCVQGALLRLCRSGRQSWPHGCHDVVKMNKGPPFSPRPTSLMPCPWQRAALAPFLEDPRRFLRLWAHLSPASTFAAPGPAQTFCPAHRPEQCSPCLSLHEESSVLGGEWAA